MLISTVAFFWLKRSLWHENISLLKPYYTVATFLSGIYSVFDNENTYILTVCPLFFKPYPQFYQISLAGVQNYVPV
jgi:hypothetical protein